MENEADIALVELVTAGMGLLALLATGIVVFVLIYQRKLSRQKLEVQELELKHNEALLRMSMRTQEEERSRFAANLHDEIGAQVAIAKMTLSSHAESQAGGPVKTSMNILDELSNAVRSLSHDLYPPHLKQLGMVAALEALCKRASGAALSVKLDSGLSVKPPEEVALHAYRLVQEALHNVMKHAEASQVTIVLRPVGNQFSLTITDNGCGFDPHAQAGHGLGILSMKKRAAMIGFFMDIHSQPGETSVTISPKNRSDEPD